MLAKHVFYSSDNEMASNVTTMATVALVSAPAAERYFLIGDKRSFFCDLVANLVPVEEAKVLAGIH